MMNWAWTDFAAIGEIAWFDLLLSGDNAVVIALACRSLSEGHRRRATFLGAGAALLLRVVFTLVAARFIDLPGLRLIAGLLLLWIAVKLMTDDHDAPDVAAPHSVWKAVATIVVADISMSLDNVVAIVSVAQGSVPLIVFGLILSVPFLIFGARLLSTVQDKYPGIAWAGAGLLGWVAGDLALTDPLVPRLAGSPPAWAPYAAGATGAAFVLALAWMIRAARARTAA